MTEEICAVNGARIIKMSYVKSTPAITVCCTRIGRSGKKELKKMKIEDQVVSLELAQEMKELGVEQESYVCWIRYIARDGSKSKWAVAQSYTPDLADGLEVYAAFTIAEVDEMLPASVRGDMVYYLHMIKTKKTKYFDQPDYYIAYAAISNKHFLHSERDDKGVDAHAKMWLFLKKEGML